MVAAREVILRCIKRINLRRIPAEFRQNLFAAPSALNLIPFSHAPRAFPGVTQLLTHSPQEENSSPEESPLRTDEEDLGQRKKAKK
jgi:hypothetical protein